VSRTFGWRRQRDAAVADQTQRPEADERVGLLLRSALFDDAWYRLCAGIGPGREAAVRHYLARGRREGLTPHPLFDPETCAASMRLGPDGPDPLVAYLRRRAFTVEVHPLVKVGPYLAAHPEAEDHADGPIGFYAETGAGQGHRVNDWYRPDPAEPRGLLDWITADATAWRRRRDIGEPVWTDEPPAAEAVRAEDARAAAISVVLVLHRPDADIAATLEGLRDQTVPIHELIVVGAGGVPEIDEELRDLAGEVRILPQSFDDLWEARNAGLAAATGDWVCWLSPGVRWRPARMAGLGKALEGPVVWAHDAAREKARAPGSPRFARQATTRARLLAGAVPDLDTVVVSRRRATECHGFDTERPGGQLLDLLLRLGEEDPGYSAAVGVVLPAVRRTTLPPLSPADRPLVDLGALASADDVVRAEHLLDWAALAQSPADADLVSVVIPTYRDWRMTTTAVDSVVAAGASRAVEIVVVDNGCGQVASAALAALAQRHLQVRLVREPANQGFSLGNDLGVAASRGDTIVFLNNDTTVPEGWLEPLLQSLEDPGVLAAQSLLVYPDGSIQSAGVVFPPGIGIPHPLLQGFPVEDAAGIENDSFHALTGAALAMRRSDVIAVRGFDPVFRNGMEDVDICLRLGRIREGRCVVRPERPVVHHESKTPGRFASSVDNRMVLVDRWREELPSDDVAAWGRRGFEVRGHRILSRVAPDRRFCVPEPVLAWQRPVVTEGPPVLRWAIKNAAPAGPYGERWGDRHFAVQLADALRRLGQRVVLDAHGAFDRPGEYVDDVALVLRGLDRHTPTPDAVNLMWLISHPELVGPDEHLGYDRVYVASTPHARDLAARGVPAVPLLQATDPSRFHPDTAAPDSGARVLFVGNSRKQARPMVMAAIEAQLPLAVHGWGWKGLIDPGYVVGTHLPNAELSAAYRSAGVVLNDHWADMAARGFLSNRLFDAVASGARVITDDVLGVREVFGDGVVIASSPEELRAIAEGDLDELFGDDETRRRRAAGIAREHSFDARARVLLDDALELWSRR